MQIKQKPARFSGKERKLLWLGCGLPLVFMGFGSLYEWNNRVPQITIPQVTLPLPNAFDSYKQATKYYVPATPVSSGGVPMDLCLDDSISPWPSLLSQKYFNC